MNKKDSSTACELCVNYVWDEEDECYSCLVNLDEDEYIAFVSNPNYRCPYFRLDDEYSIVRKQN
jgi:hypothetical protein